MIDLLLPFKSDETHRTTMIEGYNWDFVTVSFLLVKLITKERKQTYGTSPYGTIHVRITVPYHITSSLVRNEYVRTRTFARV